MIWFDGCGDGYFWEPDELVLWDGDGTYENGAFWAGDTIPVLLASKRGMNPEHVELSPK